MEVFFGLSGARCCAIIGSQLTATLAVTAALVAWLILELGWPWVLVAT